MVQVAVVLDDPETVVSTDNVFAAVTTDGEVAIGPASEIGDIAEWVFDAAPDSFEEAFGLILEAVQGHIGTRRQATIVPPTNVKVFVWDTNGPPPDGYAAWCAARFGDEP